MFDLLVCWGLLTFYAMVAGVVTMVKRRARAMDEALIADVDKELTQMERALWI